MSVKNIDPQLKLISDYTQLATSDSFYIPSYQRAYSWTIDQCDKLWQDITSFIESGAEDPYFFGTVILDCSERNRLNLIDGQQRTTTFLLLLKALHIRIGDALKALPKEEETEALRMGLRNSQAKIYRILYKADEEKQYEISKDWSKTKGIVILANDSINEIYKRDFQSIMEAESIYQAEKNVVRIPRRQKDNKYTNFFKNFKFFYNHLSNYSEAQLNRFAKAFLNKCQIIEIKSWDIEQAITMFNSLNSTGLPLSDADIISAKLYSKAGDDREEFMANWENLKVKAEELSQRKIIDIDGVLQQFMYVNRAVNGHYKLNQFATPGIRKYYTYEYPELLNEPLEISRRFTKIIAIWNKIKDYLQIKLLMKFNENFKLFLISYLDRFEPEDINIGVVEPMATLLLRLFAILEISDVGYSSARFKGFLFNENLKIADKSVTLAEIESDFNAHITNTWKCSQLKDDLMEYEKNVLVYLNDYLYARSKEKPFDFSDNVNIEHIMPSSGKNLVSIREDAGISDEEEFKKTVNLLGNKILLEEDINKSIGNDWFKTKKGKTIKEKMGYIGSQYPLAHDMASYPSDLWKKEDIDAATNKAADRILDFVLGKLAEEQEE